MRKPLNISVQPPLFAARRLARKQARCCLTRVILAAFALALVACGGTENKIPGTEVPATNANQELIQRVEEYRMALEKQDAATLLLMASKDYWEDSGTPDGADDYGYDGLKEVLAGRFQKADSIRYAVRYMRVRRRGCDSEGGICRAYVDLLVDASFTIPDSRGEMKRYDKRDQNQIVLEWDGEQWLFLSGM